MEKGGIAQLVERLLCKQDVSGSSPLTSTRDAILMIENYLRNAHRKKKGIKEQHHHGSA